MSPARGTIAYPISTIAIERTVRLVASARLRDPVLRRLVGDNYAADLAEIESATSGRLNLESRGGDKLASRELVAGLPHAAFINAAFSYWRPKELNRFNGPGRGAWYSALDVQTCIEEVAFHMTRDLDRVNDYHATIDYAEMFASFAGQFVDLRGVKPAPPCLHPDPTIGYPEGNVLAEWARSQGANGVVYPSVRHAGGICLAALWPTAVQSVTQGRILRLQWKGSRVPSATEVTE
jgi:RES domain-containing protein